MIRRQSPWLWKAPMKGAMGIPIQKPYIQAPLNPLTGVLFVINIYFDYSDIYPESFWCTF